MSAGGLTYIHAKQAAEESGMGESLVALTGQIERIRGLRRAASARRLEVLEQEINLPRWGAGSNPEKQADMLQRINRERQEQGLPAMETLEDPRPGQVLQLLRRYAEEVQTSPNSEAHINLALQELETVFGTPYLSKTNLDLWDAEQLMGQQAQAGQAGAPAGPGPARPGVPEEVKTAPAPTVTPAPGAEAKPAEGEEKPAALAAPGEAEPELEAAEAAQPMVGSWRERLRDYLTGYSGKRLSLGDEVSLFEVKFRGLPELWQDPNLSKQRKGQYLDHLVSEAERLGLPFNRNVLETFAEAGDGLREQQLGQLTKVASMVNSQLITPGEGDNLLKWLGILDGEGWQQSDRQVQEGSFFQRGTAEPPKPSDITSLMNAIGTAYKSGFSDLDTYPMRSMLWNMTYPGQPMPQGWFTTTSEAAGGGGGAGGAGAGDMETNALLIRDGQLAKEATDLLQELAGKPRFPGDVGGKPTGERSTQIQERLNEIRADRGRIDQQLEGHGFRSSPTSPPREGVPQGVRHDPKVASIVLEYAGDPRVSGKECAAWLREAGASSAEVGYYMNAYFWGRHFRPSPGQHKFDQASGSTRSTLPGVDLPAPGSDEAKQMVGRTGRRGETRKGIPGSRAIERGRIPRGARWGPPLPPPGS